MGGVVVVWRRGVWYMECGSGLEWCGGEVYGACGVLCVVVRCVRGGRGEGGCRGVRFLLMKLHSRMLAG